MDSTEISNFNKDKDGQKIFDLDLVEEKDGKMSLKTVFSPSGKMSKSGKNILEFYDKSVIKGHTVQVTIYRKVE